MVCSDTTMVAGRHFVEMTWVSGRTFMVGVQGASGRVWMYWANGGGSLRTSKRNSVDEYGGREPNLSFEESIPVEQHWDGQRPAKVGDRIGLLVDLSTDETTSSLAVYLNGKRLGIMVPEGIVPPVRWAVDLAQNPLGGGPAVARLESQQP